MDTEEVKGFSEEQAEKIRQDYNLTNHNVNKWRLRGSIPKMYLTDALELEIKTKEGLQVRPLFCWRVRLGFPISELLGIFNISRATLNKWEQGRGLPRNGGGYEELVDKLNKYVQSQYNYTHGK